MTTHITKIHKKLINTVASMLLFVALTFTQFPQSGNASTEGANRSANGLAAAFTKKYGISFGKTYSKGLLRKGRSKSLKGEFFYGNMYVLIASGCEDAYDVDIMVTDSNGNIVDGNISKDKAGIAVFTPKKNGVYFIKVTMANSTNNGAHWVLLRGFINLEEYNKNKKNDEDQEGDGDGKKTDTEVSL